MISRKGERGMALVGVLLAVLIIAVAFWLYFGRQTKEAPTRPGGPTTQLGQSLEKGHDVDCANNLRQIRYAIVMEKTNDPENARPPASLQDLRNDGIGASMLNCPVSGKPYQYNPATGQVWCTTPGHERY